MRDPAVIMPANLTVPNFYSQNLLKVGTRDMFANMNYTPAVISYTYRWA